MFVRVNECEPHELTQAHIWLMSEIGTEGWSS